GAMSEVAAAITGGPCAGMPGVGSQACELAAGDDRTGGQPAGRAARRLQRNRERCVGCNALDQCGRKIDMNRPTRLDQAERSGLVARSDDPGYAPFDSDRKVLIKSTWHSSHERHSSRAATRLS